MENYSTLSRDKTFRKRGYSVITFVVVGILALYGIIYSVENFFGGTYTEGRPGSSYATIESGTYAWAELLSSNEFEVIKDRGRITLPSNEEKIDSIHDVYTENNYDELRLDRETITVVVLDDALPGDETRELRQFIKDGGRLITDNPYLLDQILGSRATVNAGGALELSPTSDRVPGMEGVEEIRGSGIGSLELKPSNRDKSLLESEPDEPSQSINEFGRNLGVNAAIFGISRGDVIALVDTGVVSNGALTSKDNALLSLQIAGSPGSTVIFVEGVHGYKEANGFAGMPLSWRIAIVGLFVAFIIFGCAKGRRFGVGEEPDRNLGPRRIYFAHAIAQAIKKSRF